MSTISNTGVGRVGLVTGAAQGIGRAIAIRLASDGLDVAVVDIASKMGPLKEVVQEIEAQGRRAVAVAADVSRDDDVRRMVQETVDTLGSLDVMVANAGVSHSSTLVEANLDEWQKVWDVNVRGTALSYKYGAIQMIKQGKGGRIIGASSLCGKKGMAHLGAYVTSKFAIRGLTQTAALELAEHRITVNAYAPGVIQTPLTMVPTDQEPCETVKKVFGITSANVGQPGDIASAVSYFASPEAHFITGQTVNICGGLEFD